MVNSPNKKMTEAGFQHEINMQKKLLETQPNRKIKKNRTIPTFGRKDNSQFTYYSPLRSKKNIKLTREYITYLENRRKTIRREITNHGLHHHHNIKGPSMARPSRIAT